MPRSSRMYWEYVAVYGCARSLTAAVVAVTVAVGDTGGPPAPQAGSRDCANRIILRPLSESTHVARELISRARALAHR
jgi:hypothetical protein